MFTASDPSQLLQGDICKDVRFPSLTLKTAGDRAVYAEPTLTDVAEYAVVCSHSCEIVPGQKRAKGILVAPATLLKDPEPKHNQLLSSWQIGESETWDFISRFPVKINDEWYICNFSLISSMTPFELSHPYLLGKKSLQMTGAIRGNFSAKLATDFAGTTEIESWLARGLLSV